MMRRVGSYMPSPLQRGQGVMTLECGHLWSFQTKLDPKGESYDVWNPADKPTEVDCIHYPCNPDAKQWVPIWDRPDFMKTEAQLIDEALGVSEADIEHLMPGDTFTMAGTLAVNPPLRVPLPFRPLHNQVVIRVLAEKERPSPIAAPTSALNRGQSAIGVVIAKGKGHRRRVLVERGKDKRNPLDGARYNWLSGYCPLPVELGDHVVCARNMGEHHEFDGKSYLVTPVEHIFAVLGGYKEDAAPATERQFGMGSFLEKKWDRAGSEFPKVAGKNA